MGENYTTDFYRDNLKKIKGRRPKKKLCTFSGVLRYGSDPPPPPALTVRFPEKYNFFMKPWNQFKIIKIDVVFFSFLRSETRLKPKIKKWFRQKLAEWCWPLPSLKGIVKWDIFFRKSWAIAKRNFGLEPLLGLFWPFIFLSADQ